MLRNKIALVAAVAIASLSASSMVQAKEWACGNGFTCYDLPCKVGDTQMNNTTESHCVGGGALAKPTSASKLPAAKTATPVKGASASVPAKKN